MHCSPWKEPFSSSRRDLRSTSLLVGGGVTDKRETMFEMVASIILAHHFVKLPVILGSVLQRKWRLLQATFDLTLKELRYLSYKPFTPKDLNLFKASLLQIFYFLFLFVFLILKSI